MAINVQGAINTVTKGTTGGQSTVPKGKINQSLYGVSPLTQSTLQAKQGTTLSSLQSQLSKASKEAQRIQRELDKFTKLSGKGKQSLRGGAARGDDFAKNLEESAREDGKTPGDLVSDFGSVTAASERRFITPPTVMSNANKIERVIPLLDSQASNLSFNLSDSNDGSNFTNTGDETGAFGSDDEMGNFEEILGYAPDNKKKKKPEDEIIDPITAQQLVNLESMQKNADAQTKQALSSIRNKFNQREAEQRAINERGLSSIKQVLNLGGSSRYAPISSQGIISSAESAGIKALTALDAQELEVIAQIKSAQADKDYELMEKKNILLETIRKEKAATTATLQEEMQATEEQAQTDNAIVEQISQGITSPVEIFNALKAQGVQVPLSAITESLKGLNELTGGGIGGTGFKLENKAIGQLLGNGFTAPDITALQADLNAGASIDDVLEGVTDPDMQNALKEAFGLKPETNFNVTPGLGAKSSTDEAFIRTRLFSKIAPILNKGALSDSDRKIIDTRIAEFRDAGLGEQEILDTLAGLPPEVNSPYNSTFRDLIVSNSDTMEKQTSNMGRLSQQLSAGKYDQAMNTVENLALTEAKKLDPDGYMGTVTAQNYLKKIKELNKLLSKPEVQELVGPISGTFESVKGKFRSKEAQELRSKITGLVSEMRNDLSGSAVTESESKFLEPLIPSESDTWENLSLKVKALGENTLNQYNSTRSIVSLPTVTAEMVIDPKKRLQLYSNDIYLPANGTLDI